MTEDKLRAALKDGYTFRRSMAAGDLKGEFRVVVEDRTTGALGSVTIPSVTTTRMSTMFRWIPLFCFATIAAAQSTPVFRTGTRLVQVDVVVHSDRGSVKGLTKDDFTLEDKGKPQAISVFSVTQRSAPAAGLTPLPSGAVSNRINARGELAQTATVILFDRLNIGNPVDQATSRKHMLELLSSLKPTDRVGFYSLYDRVVPVQKFIDDSTFLAEAARILLAGDTTPGGLSAADQTLLRNLRGALTAAQPLSEPSRVPLTVSAFRSIARNLSGIPGRKNLLWVTSSVPLTYGGYGGARRYNDEDEMATYTRILSDANVALYPVDPRGLGSSFSSSAGSLTGTQGMQMIAGGTGGKAFINVNDISEALREVLEYVDTTYTLGFYVDDTKLDGRSHGLNVKFAKKSETAGAKLSYRKNYLAVSQTSPAVLNELPNVGDLAAEQLDATSIGVVAAAAPHPSERGLHVLQVQVNIADLHFQRRRDKWVASFDLGLALESLDGKLGSLNVLPRTLSLSADELQHGLLTGLIIDNTLLSPTQPGRVRIVIQDKTGGAAGSVRIPINPK